MLSRQLRLFFAIWPDAAAAEATSALAVDVARQSGGKAAPQERIHLTLAFLGGQPPQRVDALRTQIAAANVAPFSIAFDRVGLWRKSGIGWLAASRPPAGVIELNRAITAALVHTVSLPDDHPFSPHVTLVRRIERKPSLAMLEAPIVWQVSTFSLVSSQPGSAGPSYVRLAEWRLAT